MITADQRQLESKLAELVLRGQVAKPESPKNLTQWRLDHGGEGPDQCFDGTHLHIAEREFGGDPEPELLVEVGRGEVRFFQDVVNEAPKASAARLLRP